MRRRITLYIAGRRADLSDDGLVLMNYAVADLTNPAVLKNSWSQDVDLPRTPDNAKIFGHSGRLDRQAGTGGAGAGFNASRKTPFTIYAETGEVLVSGYLKLQAVTDDAFRVSLYGGLGELLWGLSYDTAGNKRSLADLDYGVSLDFDITAQAVADAWARLDGDGTKDPKWDVVNFAPAYNGIPENFSPDKAVALPGDIGITVPSGYNTKSGYVLVNLAGERDEWEVWDLRSYLQRPVISMRRILEAIADPANNGGWTVDVSDIIGTPYAGAWLTRPLLPGLGTYVQTSGGLSVTFQAYAAGTTVGRFTLGGVEAGTEVKARVSVTPAYRVPGAPASTLRSWRRIAGQSYVPDGYEQQILFVQAVGYGSDNTMVAAGPVRAYGKSAGDVAAADLAAALGYTPEMGAEIVATSDDHGYAPAGGYYVRQRALEAEITGANIARIDVRITAYYAYITDGGTVYAHTGGSTPFAVLYDTAGTQYQPDQARAESGSGSAASTSSDTLRSGAHVTQRMLLSSSATPAEYLVSFCKAFGMLIVADAATRSARILRRESFYLPDVTDLTKRVDRSKGIEVQPLAFDAKWYEFRGESVGGRFEEEYRRIEGVQYGIQRVDTGYDFDADAKDVLAGSAFRQAAAVQARSKYFNVLTTQGGRWYPSVFQAPGNTFTVWDGAGQAEDVAINLPGNMNTDPLNATWPGYDITHRAEFRDGENKPVDGADVLLFYRGAPMQYAFHLSDDLPVMDTLNGGPCWILDAAAGSGLAVPSFSRYHTIRPMGETRADVLNSLDFGIPRELDIPGLDYSRGTVYLARWRKFITDRLSVHGKVLRCRVDLAGLQVGPELLRGFFWYEGSLWALSKITNYSLTTFDPAECEFIQVRDIDNYTT